MKAAKRSILVLSTGDEVPEIVRSTPALFLLAGPRHSGKTTTARRWVSHWRDKGHQVHGILALARYDASILQGYEILDLSDDAAYPLVGVAPFPCGTRQGRFYFDSTGFEALQEKLSAGSDTEVFVIDEIGPLELYSGGGWRRLLDKMLASGPDHLLIVIRDYYLSRLLHYLAVS